MIAAHNNIALARQQLLPGDVISGYITNGGSAINIIPAYTSASFATRAPSKQRLAAVNERLYQCFEAGALASGAKVEITKGNQYDDHVPNKLIGGSYRHWFNLLGGHIPAPEIDLVNGLLPGGTDQGNVSHIIPSLHGVFHIHSEVGIHSADFALAAKTEGAHEKAMVVAKALALTGLDFLTCQDLIDELRNDFPLI
jgi:metal-dependent amidase/aminoacylase/carboxypeptidase family protein